MKLFQNSLSDIDSIIKNKRQSYSRYDNLAGIKNLDENLSKGQDGIIITGQDKVIAKADYTELQGLFGIHKFSFSDPFIGPHPDFKHLEHDQYMNHYAVSMFLDIKGSTELSKRYDLLQIRQIKDTILTLAIQVCSFFGGHIQRLQGDGIFIYFVRTSLYDSDAVINALNAASLMTFFMKYQLPVHFKDEEIQPPKVRIGIDYGDSEKTIWSYYGLSFCRELTTTSLHTDLAAKLQSKADPNGIRIGNNIVEMLDLQPNLVKKIIGEEFIFNDSYRQWNFDWESFLLSFDFIRRDSERNLTFETPKYRLHCEIADRENGLFVNYPQNLFSIPKEYKIKFTLKENDQPYNLRTLLNEHIEWQIVNTGKEAAKAQKLKESMQDYKDMVTCMVDAKYLGHHDMQCKIVKSGNQQNINVRYPVFVR